ncbi:hypothetical protein [Streptomyces anulatus]|uniref:hypothetical protein n=1 Tax=Streptomyces anulatus TaxID=1892 RepID=UPI001C265797|nr:hypothetical protein [Streptomyces anulatus]
MPHDTDPADRQPSAKKTRAPVPQTPAEWREALRREELPPELADLPRRQRRRARKHWRSARRDARTEWIRAERRKTPTTLVVPILALIVAGVVAGAAWLMPDHDRATPQTGHTGTSAPPAPASSAAEESSPSPAPTFTTPDEVAKAFVTAYTTRFPLKDQTHDAAVDRAAPYASTPLVANLKKHEDKDFNKLVASQAVSAKPTEVTVGQPSDKQRPAVDTSIRVWRQADVTLAVTGTDDYTYTRHLTVEVTRADAASPWTVTRVLGIQE